MTHLSCLSEKQTSSSQESEGGEIISRPGEQRNVRTCVACRFWPKVFNVPFSFFPVRFSEFVMLTLESALPAPLLSLISIRSIEPPVPFTNALTIAAFAPRRIFITSCIRSTLSALSAALFTIVMFSTRKSDWRRWVGYKPSRLPSASMPRGSASVLV